ncbi:TRAP transporter substrate-binding protein DctP [Halalkalibacter alkaliphilus]|uniref:TRAP transporter substrate-binding protein DctP n=1 Tax=Halalkalibacter alkaliphilus TaxID=2917993 RepID=A0A9X2CUR4_9BACI|nr:TRAP transporter substrate-binding protein DctP [Halalkalibacter alkaliphilus]MCL7748475.1 TRAP transporter substrate-binding protein DctP [Halalkalibacter alkaliphilus]
MKKLSKSLILSLALFGLIGCSSSTNTETTTSEENPGQEAESRETINLIASTHSPPGIPLTLAWDAYLDEIEERSEGQIEFERYYNGGLSDGFDVIDAVGNGIADVAVVFPSWQSGKLPLNTIASNPGLHENAWTAVKASNELRQLIPEVNQELENHGNVNIGNFGAPPMYFISTDSLTSFDDLKGQQVLTNSPTQAKIAGELGMVPVGMNLTDAYDALTRGIVDTVLFSAQGAMSFGLHESAKHAWKLPMGTTTGLYTMNKTVWDSLPADLQAVIEEVKEEFQPESFHTLYQVTEEEYEEKFIEAGGTIVEPTEEDLNFMMDIITTHVWDEWIKEQEDKGLPGEDVLNTYKELVEKYEQENPFK